jgi:hypothetical protein
MRNALNPENESQKIELTTPSAAIRIILMPESEIELPDTPIRIIYCSSFDFHATL